MSGSTFAPLPQAPTASVPLGLSAAGAAQHAWTPNMFCWVLAWRAFICIELVVALTSGLAPNASVPAVIAAATWTLISVVPARWVPLRRGVRRAVLIVDLLACVALLALARDDVTLSLLAAYACSSAVSWAANRPIDAFIAGGSCAAAFIAIVVGSPVAELQPQGITGTLSLLLFFSLATSGFFTVAHRIGALEIAEEISRERGRYRRDLHDRLGQALSGMHFEVQAVEAVGLDEHAPARLDSLANGYRDAQRMLQDLFRAGDEPMVGTNITSVISQEARRMGQQAGVRIGVETTGDASRVPPWMRPHVVAVAGESVNNAIKNGHAGNVDVSVDVADELLVLSVTDDGVGFDNPPGTITEKAGHYGLREMAERARICGGEVVIASQPGFGTRVRLQVPIPQGATQDVLERDASRLRENVWSLVMTLRVLLGVAALLQLVVTLTRAADPAVWPLLALTLVVTIDVTVVAVRSRSVRLQLARSSTPASLYSLGVGLIVGVCLLLDVDPVILLYAPMLLLGVGVAHGRRGAALSGGALLGACLAASIGASLVGALQPHELRGMLVHMTDMALLAMAAVQGAKLLDRLEALQVRVRYQALARLRHGLSGRMRDQLAERLQQLEDRARQLARQPTDPEQFAAATAQLTRASTELKQQLRDIVHTLADPTPQQGRTPVHV